jgi:phosphate transport system permease protein
MLIAVPFGLGAAVFVSEFCDQRVRETLKIVIELLAAIPSGRVGDSSAFR